MLRHGVLGLTLAVGVATGAHAEPVSLDIEGTPAIGELILAEGKSLADGVVMLVHGTMGHHTMEIIAGQQERLKERGLNTLAVSLTLDVPSRAGMLECDEVHRHSHQDAIGEIAAWLGWLETQGASDITLFGHSRGGNQVAQFATLHSDAAKADRIVLVAPSTWSADAEALSYESRWKAPLQAQLVKAGEASDAGAGDVPVKVPGFLYCGDAKATPAAFLSYHGEDESFDTPSLVGAIQQPVIVVAADGDEVVPDLEARFDPEWPATVETAVVVDSGHMFRDFAADDLADLIEDFATR